MNEQMLFTIFIVIFILLYGSVNFYVVHKIFKIFKIDNKVLLYLLPMLIVGSFIFGNALISKVHNPFSKLLYLITSTWMGAVFLAFVLFLIYDLINIFYQLPALRSGMVVIAIVLILTLYSIFNAFTIRTFNITLENSKIDKPLTIVMFSDVHLGPIYGKGFLEEIVKRSNELEPDIVLIPGDLLDGGFPYNPDDFNEFNKLKGKVYFTIGNHEHYAGLDVMNSVLKDKNVTILRNALAKFKNIQIIGIDDAEDRKQVDKQLSTIDYDRSKYTILLYHRPPGFKYAAANGVDLMLVGHTHAGQIYPFNYLSALANGLNRGLHRENDSFLYISQGIGTWGPPMRLGSRSEIVRISVYPSK
jgi:uncharacterized protein